MASDSRRNHILNSILEMITALGSANFKTELAETDEPELASIILGLNSLAKNLQAQAQAHAQSNLVTHNILETMADGLIIHDENGSIETCNSAALKLLGISHDQLLGLSSLDQKWKATREDGTVFPGEQHPAMVALKIRQPVRDVLMGLELPDGKKNWLKINAVPFESHSGLKVVCTFSDVSALLNAKTEINFVLGALKIGVWRFDPVKDELSWDKSMYELYEIEEDEFGGHYQAWESTLSLEDKAKAVDDLQKALKGEKDFDTTFKIKNKTGRPKYIGGRGIVIRSSDGTPVLMYGINWDKTDGETLRQEQRKAISFLNSVLQNAPVLIFAKDCQNDLKYSFINKAGEQIIDTTYDQFVGKSDFEFFPEDQAILFRQDDQNIIESRSIFKVEKPSVIKTRNGDRYLSTVKVPTYSPGGEPELIIGISMDITDKLLKEKQLESERTKAIQNAKLASLGEMAAGIAHEINNPLAIILGTAEIISHPSTDPVDFAARIKVITHSCDRINRIVSGLRKFSRTSEKPNLRAHDLNLIAKEAMTLTENKSKRYWVPVSLDCEDRHEIYCDEVEIEQVIINLINNGIYAVKDHQEKWVKLHIFKQDRDVVLRLTDSGTGIPDTIRDKIFNPFFTTKRIGDGTGLGLSISKSILDEHNATIRLVDESPNTCFEVRFLSLDNKNTAA